jgi:hypothetical protein
MFVQNFVELCCVVYNDLECFEADLYGNYISLSRHVVSTVISSPSNEVFVKDVTDAFRRKVSIMCTFCIICF